MDFSKPLTASTTSIPGLLIFELPVMGDNRGWFKENWQRKKMTAKGLPDFHPVQNNISFNEKAGTTRGIHAEPWGKFISVASGEIFGAWVDLREGENFGAVFTARIDPSRAVYVPRGVGNAFQTLADNTVYTYLVNEHWSPDADYTSVNLADKTIGIAWPIPLAQAELSEKDKHHPMLSNVTPMRAKKTLILGANGQLGKALRALFSGDPTMEFAGREEFDLNDPDSFRRTQWSRYRAVINAAAYTQVDEAQTPTGRKRAWATNVTATVRLAQVAIEHDLTLVHISSDYVFDGTRKEYSEEEPVCPLGAYGQTKAAADAVVQTVPRHYILRTSWVVGDGPNFVRTMAKLARQGIKPTVIDDQHGRLTFTSTLAAAIDHLLTVNAEYGIYNVANDGPTQSWAQIAQDVYRLTAAEPTDITPVSSETYFADKPSSAPRPSCSTLNLGKINDIGFTPEPALPLLKKYLKNELPPSQPGTR